MHCVSFHALKLSVKQDNPPMALLTCCSTQPWDHFHSTPSTPKTTKDILYCHNTLHMELEHTQFRPNSAMWSHGRKQQQHHSYSNALNAESLWMEARHTCEKLQCNMWNNAMGSTCVTTKAYPSHKPQKATTSNLLQCTVLCFRKNKLKLHVMKKQDAHISSCRSNHTSEM